MYIFPNKNSLSIVEKSLFLINFVQFLYFHDNINFQLNSKRKLCQLCRVFRYCLDGVAGPVFLDPYWVEK